MNQQPSQDLSKVREQVKAQQEKLHHLHQATKKAQDEWDDQRKQIANDTEVVIATSQKAIESELKVAKEELATVNDKLNIAQKGLISESKIIQDTINDVKSQLNDIEHEKSVLTVSNNELRNENRNLQSEITVAKNDIETYSEHKQTLTKEIATLSVSKEQLDTDMIVLEGRFEGKTAEINQLEQDYTRKTDEYNNQLSILESQKQDIMQEIIDNRAQQDGVRDNLSKWSKTLDEKDKNLRIREAKVDQKEKSIIRNYNLLNL